MKVTLKGTAFDIYGNECENAIIGSAYFSDDMTKLNITVEKSESNLFFLYQKMEEGSVSEIDVLDQAYCAGIYTEDIKRIEN